jgi:pyrroline-5-carboxylate reductase
MGRALAAALIHKKVCPPEAILLVDPDPACREAGRELGCEVEQASGDGLGAAPVVVMAVKPQTAPEVYGKVRPLLNPEQVVVSIMAGVTMSALKEGLGHEAVVRVMPNTPAQVGLGMNVFYADPSVAAQKLEPVAALLNASGEALAVPSEDAIDAATAVSGSGPAYVFYVAEHWMKAAVKLGFDESEAATLVQQTLLGATKLWKAQNGAVSRLREQVTSKGGTTAAALESFQADSVGTGLEAGIERAYQRAKELGRGS